MAKLHASFPGNANVLPEDIWIVEVHISHIVPGYIAIEHSHLIPDYECWITEGICATPEAAAKYAAMSTPPSLQHLTRVRKITKGPRENEDHDGLVIVI